jgi:hypothetical protein
MNTYGRSAVSRRSAPVPADVDVVVAGTFLMTSGQSPGARRLTKNKATVVIFLTIYLNHHRKVINIY